jgi:Membrane proteins related to metalloendopeptidases
MAKRTKRIKENSAPRRLRVTVGDDATHEELFHFKTTKGSFRLVVALIALAIIAGTYCLTAYTPVRRTIPGYPSNETRRKAMENLIKIDSLENVIGMWSYQMTNIQRIVSGKSPIPIDSLAVTPTSSDESIRGLYAENDSLLREEVRRQEQFNISLPDNSTISQIEGLHFFTPVKGIITEPYDKSGGHPYVDIAAETGTMVYAVLGGTVISALWNDEVGYILEIQHDNDIISIYKHNERLLKKTGDVVKAGTPVAQVGNTGILSTGSHLHFELWHKGSPIDPTLYIKF